MNVFDQLAQAEAALWAQTEQLQASIQAQLDELHLEREIIREQRAAAAQDFIKSLSFEDLADPQVQRQLAELGWDRGRGLDKFDEALAQLVKSAGVYLRANHSGWQVYDVDEAEVCVINWTVSVPKDADEAVLGETARCAEALYTAALAYAPMAVLDVDEHTYSEDGTYFIVRDGDEYVLSIRVYGRVSDVFRSAGMLDVLTYVKAHCWRG